MDGEKWLFLRGLLSGSMHILIMKKGIGPGFIPFRIKFIVWSFWEVKVDGNVVWLEGHLGFQNFLGLSFLLLFDPENFYFLPMWSRTRLHSRQPTVSLFLKLLSWWRWWWTMILSGENKKLWWLVKVFSLYLYLSLFFIIFSRKISVLGVCMESFWPA